MFNVIDKIINRISKVSLAIVVGLGLTMLFIMLIAVFSRYVLQSSLLWGEEILKMMLIWFGLLSVGIIAHQREHIGVVIFKEHMPYKVQIICGMVSQILMLIASIVLVFIGIWLVQKSGNQLTPALRIPYGIGYLGIPVSFALMTIYELRNTVFEIMHFKEKLIQPAKIVVK